MRKHEKFSKKLVKLISGNIILFFFPNNFSFFPGDSGSPESDGEPLLSCTGLLLDLIATQF